MATKGYDDSPPRNGTILFYTLVTLVFLVGVKLTLDSYFAVVMGGEVQDKILTRGMEAVKAMRTRETRELAPHMGRAQELLSQRGRAAAPMIAPQSGMGEDGLGMEEIRGWTKLGRKVRPIRRPEPAAEGAPTEGAPTEGAQAVSAEPAPVLPAKPEPGAAPGVVN